MSASNCLVITSNFLVIAGLSPHLGWLFSAPSTQITPKIPQKAADPPARPLLDHPINPSLFRAQFPSALVTPTPGRMDGLISPKFSLLSPQKGVSSGHRAHPCPAGDCTQCLKLNYNDRTSLRSTHLGQSGFFPSFFSSNSQLVWVLFTANPKLWQLHLIKLCFG